MPFTTLFETQEVVVKLLNNSRKKNRLVHTYIFEGARGTAKIDAAYYFAAMLLCQGEHQPCLRCEECLKVINRNSPNIIMVFPENNTIRKEQADNLVKEFSLKPHDDKPRIFIINDIEKATLAAANSLLKFLEEAGDGNYGILITEDLYGVLPTIRSRAQIISFSQLWPRVIAEKLASLGVEEEISHILSYITNSTDECLEMINDGKILDIIDFLRKITNSLLNKEKAPLIVLYEAGKFLLSETDKRYHNIFLDLMITFYSNVLYLALHQNDKIIFKHIIGNASAEALAPSWIISEIETLLSYKQKLKYNINMYLFYTQMLTELEL